MTVLGIFLNKEARTGGHKRYLELLGGLAASGVRVIAFFDPEQTVRPAGVQAIELRIPKPSPLPRSVQFRKSALGALPELLRQSVTIDWIVIFGETHLGAAVALKKKTGARILYSHRSNAVREGFVSLAENLATPWRLFPILTNLAKSRLYESLIARRADILVFQSPFDRDDFLHREPESAPKTAIIRGNIGEPRFKAAYSDTNRSEQCRRILFVGTFGERKGARYFLEAAVLLRSRLPPDASFQLVGYGSKRERLEKFVREQGLADRVTFLGRLTDPLPTIAAADLLVVPSLFDSYPNTVLEALHVGTPVIGSLTGGIPDILRYQELLFPIRDAAALADRIYSIVTDEEFYARLRELCAERKGNFMFDWAAEFKSLMADSLDVKRSDR